MSFPTLAGLLEAQSRSSGEVWLFLLEVTHPNLPETLRLVSPSIEEVVSNGNTYLPSRIDGQLGSQRTGEPNRITLTIEAISGEILQALLDMAPISPAVEFAIITLSDPDTDMVRVRDLVISPGASGEGTSGITVPLSAERVNSLPFPGINMTRDRVSGIYLDI